MHQLDYELGLKSADEDWNDADGRGAAKAVLIACIAKCKLSHPFNKSKRLSCEGKCNAAYAAKISYIDSNISQDSSALEEAKAQSCPAGMTVYGDGSACKDNSGNSCALWGNLSKPRCSGYSLPKATTKELPKTQTPKSSGTSGTRTNEGASEEEPKKAGLGTGAMIGIGVGAVVLILGGMYILKRKNK